MKSFCSTGHSSAVELNHANFPSTPGPERSAEFRTGAFNKSPMPPTTPKQWSARKRQNATNQSPMYHPRPRLTYSDSNPFSTAISNLINNLETSNYNKITFEKKTIKEISSLFDNSQNSPKKDNSLLFSECYVEDPFFEKFSRLFKSRDYPSLVPTDKQQAIYLSHALLDAINELNAIFPDYYKNPNLMLFNHTALKQELSIWVYITSEAIRQVSMHSKALALLLETLFSRFITFSNMLFLKPPDKKEVTFEEILGQSQPNNIIKNNNSHSKSNSNINNNNNNFNASTTIFDTPRIGMKGKSQNDLFDYESDDSDANFHIENSNEDDGSDVLEDMGLDTFCDEINHLLEYFKQKSPKNIKIENLTNKLQKIKFFVSENERLNKQIQLLMEDIEKLKTEKREIINENFELTMQKEKAVKNLAEVMKVNEGIRETLVAREHTISLLMEKRDLTTQPESMGMVPESVLKIWYQISFFCKTLLNYEITDNKITSSSENLLNINAIDTSSSENIQNRIDHKFDSSDNLENIINLNDYFPRNIRGKFNPPAFSFHKPKFEKASNKRYHYAALFTEMKNDFDEQVLDKIENKITQFLKAASYQYQSNFMRYKASQQKIASSSVQKLNEIRMQQKQDSNWIQILLSCREILKVPKKIPKNMNIDVKANLKIDFNQNPVETMKKIYYHVATNSIKSTVSYQLMRFFKPMGNQQLMYFLTHVATRSQKELDFDIFRKFLMNEIPYHSFIFYSLVQFRSKDFGVFDSRSRMKLIAELFDCVGWSKIPRQKKTAFDSLFCSDSTKFCMFCLSLYQFAIEKIKDEFHGINDQNEIEEIIKEKLEINDDQKLFEKIEYMKTINGNTKITPLELSIVLFNGKYMFENEIILPFEAENDPLLQYIVNFGVKSKKVKTTKASKNTTVNNSLNNSLNNSVNNSMNNSAHGSSMNSGKNSNIRNNLNRTLVSINRSISVKRQSLTPRQNQINTRAQTVQ
ncbi:hypothetical protein TRFO_02682 [Tritrichomonas foetus]|uniref:Uncharacterized protein n=1 Tax=Tritrichomonas foetus TaxID=1144522 RepID=A0A1J4KZ45_9EUKA|nr:hypothetical protein TRFO_02682 [Tritrichomonas foetus]|eukprot:OHT16426.1 hypothetical protein TRFO_02682 [Tritrichomonas foetus]